VYDALLAMRGWGKADFASVSPGFLAVVRHGLLAERIHPELDGAREVLATKPENVEPSQRPTLNRLRREAHERTASLRAMLLLEDDRGGA